jgi:hypothetical protein
VCARNEIRTRTSLRMPPPQDGASTNFATRAFIKYKVLSQKPQPAGFDYRLKTFNGCARRETRTLKRQFSTASETATFTNFAIRAFSEDANIIVLCNAAKINAKNKRLIGKPNFKG